MSVDFDYPCYCIYSVIDQTALKLKHFVFKSVSLYVICLRYRLVPYGNHSYLESLTDKSKELPLYSAGGIKFFWDTKYVVTFH